ncbi:MAG TPA: HIT domain-containing protein, partial [Candidatus Bilamarchaeaceae archaeon]|nr:HIT domain-containing protein [Candidatus Bilamarchaeaceae archaeon]
MIRRIIGPRWAEKSSGQASGHLKDGECRFCPLREEPLVSKNGIHVLRVLYPYYPEHVMILPQTHRKGLLEFDETEFTQFVEGAERLVVGARERTGLGIIIAANQGVVAAQTLDHFHAHAYPVPLGEPARIYSGNVFFRDPLSNAIIDAYMEKEAPSSFWLDRKVGGALLLFEGFRALARSLGEVKELFAGLEKAFARIRANPELACGGRKDARAETARRLLLDRTGQGFGINWMLSEDTHGVAMTIVPRATVISLTERNRRIATLELFAQTRLSR